MPAATTRPFSGPPDNAIFRWFTPYSGPGEPGYAIDFLGCKTRCSFVRNLADSGAGVVSVAYPPVDEEYFEWIDVLESVFWARERYTMIELGAGYGRWCVRAATALRQKRPGAFFRLVAVEAEPVHFAWLQEHFRDNGLNPQQHVLIQAAVTNQSGEIFFYVGRPDGEDGPDAWYGQAITAGYETAASVDPRGYHGKAVIKHATGWASIAVPCVTLRQVFAQLPDDETVDLLDLDVQGEELKVISSAIEEVNRRVRRLHIGTHNHEIEDGLRALLQSSGWRNIWDFPCLSSVETAWGTVDFNDGVQGWINPSLE